MDSAHRRVVIGTRGSPLARWQTDFVAARLREAWPELIVDVAVFSTHGDRVLDTPLPLIGGKGVFTAELEAALRAGEIDFAVHSLKDLPTVHPTGLTIGATPRRVTPLDALVSRAALHLDALPEGATVGTSSLRRSAQLRRFRPDLRLADIRGNVDTRLRKALEADGPYDAILLAAAGLERLGLGSAITQFLPMDVMLPAPGQAALAVQCREDPESLRLLAPVEDRDTRLAVTAERAFLAGLGGGCSLPIAAFGAVEGDELRLHGRVTAPDGHQQVDVNLAGPATLDAASQLGMRLAWLALERGSAHLLETAP